MRSCWTSRTDLPDAQKPAGRVSVAEWLTTGAQAWVRINSVTTPDWSSDLDALAHAPGLLGVMLGQDRIP